MPLPVVCKSEGQQEELFLQLGKRFRAVFLEPALISESKIDVKSCAVLELGLLSSQAHLLVAIEIQIKFK